LELEWLIDNFAKFYSYIVQQDEAIFDNKVITFILNELDFSKQAILQFIFPKMCQIALFQYYYSFELTKAELAAGYLSGHWYTVVVRLLTLGIQLEFIYVYVVLFR
jgi:hypothetical protein